MFLCIGFILFVKINYIVGLCIKLYIFVFVFSDYFKILLLLDVFLWRYCILKIMKECIYGVVFNDGDCGMNFFGICFWWGIDVVEFLL